MERIKFIRTKYGFYYLNHIPVERLREIVELCFKYKPLQICILAETQRGRICDYHTMNNLEVIPNCFFPAREDLIVNTTDYNENVEKLAWLNAQRKRGDIAGKELKYCTLFFKHITPTLIDILWEQLRVFPHQEPEENKIGEEELQKVLKKKQTPWGENKKPRLRNNYIGRSW